MQANSELQLTTTSNRKNRIIAIYIFLMIWITSGWFQQSRDWNVASRLMLVYALGDRGSVSIDGLQRQTGDLAFKDGHYYCDKAPGFSLLATPSYLVGKMLFSWPEHPLNQDGFAYWPADTWITWCTSGLASAAIATSIFIILRLFGIAPVVAACCGMFTVWASPMFVYATLSYGHQVASGLFMIASVVILKSGWRQKPNRLIFVGICCGFGVLTELAQAPIAIVMGLSVLASDFHLKSITRNSILMILSATPAALLLIGYNTIAFGSALDMGYFHHATQQFAKVHSADNPLGLTGPDLGRIQPLLWGEYRGLLFYAPWAVLAPVGWCLMLVRRKIALLCISLAGFVVPLWVNLSYPEWTGGWSTGPRLLVPALPWLGLAAGYSFQLKSFRILSIPLYCWGWLVAIMFAGVGGRISQDIQRPFQDAVLPLWTSGRRPIVWTGERFARTNLQSLFHIDFISTPWLIAGLVAFQVLTIAGLFLIFRVGRGRRTINHPVG